MNPLTGISNTRGPPFSTDMCPLTGTDDRRNPISWDIDQIKIPYDENCVTIIEK